LGQSWWGEIQYLGLLKELKNNDSEIGRTLKSFFGLSLLSPEKNNDCYIENENVLTREPIWRHPL